MIVKNSERPNLLEIFQTAPTQIGLCNIYDIIFRKLLLNNDNCAVLCAQHEDQAGVDVSSRSAHLQLVGMQTSLGSWQVVGQHLTQLCSPRNL